jgi:hypothetical protein
MFIVKLSIVAMHLGVCYPLGIFTHARYGYGKIYPCSGSYTLAGRILFSRYGKNLLPVKFVFVAISKSTPIES